MLTLFKTVIWIDYAHDITTCPPLQIFIPEHDHGRAKRRRRKFFPRDLTMMMKMKPLPTIRPSTTERHGPRSTTKANHHPTWHCRTQKEFSVTGHFILIRCRTLFVQKIPDGFKASIWVPWSPLYLRKSKYIVKNILICKICAGQNL